MKGHWNARQNGTQRKHKTYKALLFPISHSPNASPSHRRMNGMLVYPDPSASGCSCLMSPMNDTHLNCKIIFLLYAIRLLLLPRRVCVLALESPQMRLLLYHTVHTDSSENHQASTNKDVPRQFHITMLFCRCWGRESKRRRRSRRSLIVELTLYGYIFTFVAMGCLTCLSFWRFSSGYWKIASQAEEQRVMWFE